MSGSAAAAAAAAAPAPTAAPAPAPADAAPAADQLKSKYQLAGLELLPHCACCFAIFSSERSFPLKRVCDRFRHVVCGACAAGNKHLLGEDKVCYGCAVEQKLEEEYHPDEASKADTETLRARVPEVRGAADPAARTLLAEQLRSFVNEKRAPGAWTGSVAFDKDAAVRDTQAESTVRLLEAKEEVAASTADASSEALDAVKTKADIDAQWMAMKPELEKHRKLQSEMRAAQDRRDALQWLTDHAGEAANGQSEVLRICHIEDKKIEDRRRAEFTDEEKKAFVARFNDLEEQLRKATETHAAAKAAYDANKAHVKPYEQQRKELQARKDVPRGYTSIGFTPDAGKARREHNEVKAMKSRFEALEKQDQVEHMRQLKETAVREKEQTDKALATERQQHAELRAIHDQLVAHHEAAGGTSGNGAALAEAQQTIKALKEDVETMKGVSANLVGQKRKLAEDHMAAAVEAEAFRRAIVQFPFHPDEAENHQKQFDLLRLAAKTVEEHRDELVEEVQRQQREAAEAAEAAEAGGASSSTAPPPAKKKKKKAPAAAAGSA